ncbi:MAG: LysM peptidoglycan-binding domain-containing protein, partial [Clostridiales bacterium]
MKRTILYVSLISLSCFFSACSLSNVSSNDKSTNKTAKTAAKPTIIVNELLEEARQNYVNALAKQEINATSEAINYYETALRTINNLSYYPEIDENEAYTQLEKSITEDYQKFVDGLTEVPEGVSFAALQEWMGKSLPELKIKNEVKESKSQVVIVSDFPLEINSYVEQWIDIYSKGKFRYLTERWLPRTGKYFPMMAKIFQEEKVPTQIVFLSMVESGVNPTARSVARAVGMWQFMPGTGPLYGLNIDFYYDERRDPEKATHAAAKYLKSLYGMFGDWYLAMAAYNWGPGKMQRLVERTGKRSFWEIRDYMPRETREYVPQFIALSIIAANPQKYGFENVMYQKPLEYDVFSVKDCIDLKVLASCAGTTYDAILELNPELTQMCTPQNYSGGYQLKIPKGSAALFASNLQKVPDEAKVQFSMHYVKKKETVTSIAHKYGISPRDLAKVNGISTNTKLYKGVALKIPVSGFNASDIAFNTDTTPAVDKTADTRSAQAPYTVQSTTINSTVAAANNSAPAANASAPAATEQQPSSTTTVAANDNNSSDDNANDNESGDSNSSDSEEKSDVVIKPEGKALVQYTVKKNDNINGIADLFDIRTSDLRNWNNIAYTDRIKVGQALNIYVPQNKKDYYASLDNQTASEKKSMKITSSVRPSVAWVSHKVKKGETLKSIASKYRVSIASLRQWNGIRGTKVRPGAKVKIQTIDNTRSIASNVKSNYKRSGLTRYKIRRGDTIGEIADRYGVSVSQLKKWNNLSGKTIVAGTNLKIYGNETTVALGDNTPKAPANLRNHVVKSGETIGMIAEKYHVSVSNIKKWNKLNSNKIKAGKSIKVYSDSDDETGSMPEPKSRNAKNEKTSKISSKKAVDSEVHQVKKGETLAK